MIDFSKRLSKPASDKLLDPAEIYETLDRASDKGPLRPPQAAILREWHTAQRSKRDLIVKLHTGQGKTLVGLLMLQSKLNEGKGPAVYLCPNNFLINQTRTQASQFGIRVCTATPDIPAEFLDGQAILVTSVQKMFNGLTKFKTGPSSIKVSTVLMDDAHACVDSIRDSFAIKLAATSDAYLRLRELFEIPLSNQGAGSFADIKNGSYDALLPVPYWEWHDKEADVVRILAKDVTTKPIKFAWPLIKDLMAECQCVVSGKGLEISPYLAPLDLFGSYFNAEHRIFMSATVTDDSFLVKGLRLDPETIRNPLVYEKEKWSGEKMVLIPELIHETLDRNLVIEQFAPPKTRTFGVVAVTPSGALAEKWAKAGAIVVTPETIDEAVENLRDKKFGQTLAIANRYDGIDLADDTCRILILDSKPYSDSLVDRLASQCRASSEVIAVRVARSIEQGLGRSVRGEKDYCVIVLTGADLVETVRSKESRGHLSSQTQTQIEIGLEIAQMAREELARGTEPLDGLNGLIDQCLKRDNGWKQFYVERMNALAPSPPPSKVLDLFKIELDAEIAFQEGDWSKAKDILQRLIDTHVADNGEKGWYLQEIARYVEPFDKTESNKFQITAHKKNRFLLRPRDGMQVTKIIVSKERVAKIIDWVGNLENYEALQVAVFEITERLSFGISSDRFEGAVHRLGQALGFDCERPDKEWKEGPDNLWALRENLYLLIECKNEVSLDRTEIHKDESGQMNNAAAWFARNYPGVVSKNILVIPTDRLAPAAGFNIEVETMRPKELGRLVRSVKNFFKEFKSLDFQNLDPRNIQELLNSHALAIDDLVKIYSKNIKAP